MDRIIMSHTAFLYCLAHVSGIDLKQQRIRAGDMYNCGYRSVENYIL